MNLSACSFLNHPNGFQEPLGKTGFKSIGLTCCCHQYWLTCLRNLVYSVDVEGYPRFVHGRSAPFTRSRWAKGG